MGFIVKGAIVALLAIVCGIPLYMNGYIIGHSLNDFFGHYCDLKFPVMDTSVIEWTKIMRGNASEIYEEFVAFETQHGHAPRVSEVEATQHYLDNQPDHAWRTLFLRLYGRDSVHMKHFPKLQAAIAQAPPVYTVIISAIDPHYHGNTHIGLYRGVHRYLLGLKVGGDSHMDHERSMAVPVTFFKKKSE